MLAHRFTQPKRSLTPRSAPAAAPRASGPLAGRAIPILILLCAFAMLATGCAGRAWKAALEEDTPASYYRFMRDHPDSPQVAAAQEHLDFHKLKRDLTLQAFAEFNEKYPESELSDELRPRLEPQAFALARAGGTVASYERFLAQFPRGAMKARAEGNLAYLEGAGFGGEPAALAAFARAHPESDFAAEAERSAVAPKIAQESRFDRVGLSVDIAPGTPQAKQLRERFTDIAEELYEDSGVELVVLPEIIDPRMASELPSARLTVAHREEHVSAKVEGGAVSRPGMLARTRVTLQREPGARPSFEREFTLRLNPQDHISGSSVLFSTAGPYFWKGFFVPVGSWQNIAAVRPPVALSGRVVAVDATADRAVALYENGNFQLLELADPSKPVVLTHFERPQDFKNWSGVRSLGERRAIFGEEGIEILAFGPAGPKVVQSFSRSEIGTVFAVEAQGELYIVAGARGLLVVSPDSRQIKRLMRRVIKGLALVGDTMIFTDGESLYVSNLTLLGQKRVLAQLRLGKSFAPGRVRSFEDRAIAIGESGVLLMQVIDGQKPTVVARLGRDDIGDVYDAAGVSGRIFLVGNRGLQLLSRSGRAVVEHLDVDAMASVAAMGRHVVTVGEGQLQVVDATGLVEAATPAAQNP